MFDPRTAAILQSAPSFKDLDAEDLPRILSQRYAEIVSARLRGEENENAGENNPWTLQRIADTYEIVANVEAQPESRRAAAFVSASARQVLARIESNVRDNSRGNFINRASVDHRITAVILFLLSEQYSDALQASRQIPEFVPGLDEFEYVVQHVRNLGMGRLHTILDVADQRRKEQFGTKQERKTLNSAAMQAIGRSFNEGIELLAADLLLVEHPFYEELSFSSAKEAFLRILDICSHKSPLIAFRYDAQLNTTYPGPAHLASLLISAADTLGNASLTKLPIPPGSNGGFWRQWLRYRAEKTPYVWPNHREAIDLGFHANGVSGVLVLPTGAGKTTVSSLKIAATLASGKSVIFLAPTHALVEQLTDDLLEIFPESAFGLGITSDSDTVLFSNSTLQDVEVMTPERCLTIMSFSPKSFETVGLLVFDECHLLSPEAGKDRRALDSMLCLLTLISIVPSADMLFLSAMLRNGLEFAGWIEKLTERRCIAIDLLWKPSRQVRGVVVFEKQELSNIATNAIVEQITQNTNKKKVAKDIRVSAAALLNARPFAVWGLQHNWLTSGKEAYFTTAILNRDVRLSGSIIDGRVRLTPNANKVAADIAAIAAMQGVKVIVFVGTKNDALSVAHDIAAMISEEVTLSSEELHLHHALMVEFGGLKHCVFGENFAAVPHNSAMIKVERALAERIYRRENGARVIVATPTLAQGLNLPAQLAILAGDKRVEAKGGARVAIKAHELLNAAARAGRAGHLTNGTVLLVPEPVCSFVRGQHLPNRVAEKLLSVLPEDDRCVYITDPLERIIDSIMSGADGDRDVRYTVSRLALLSIGDFSSTDRSKLMSRSLGSYIASVRREDYKYQERIKFLLSAVDKAISENNQPKLFSLASQTGLSVDILERLRLRAQYIASEPPESVIEWLNWVLQWLEDDDEARVELLGEAHAAIMTATGSKSNSPLVSAVVGALRPGILAWVLGEPIRSVEIALGGDPDSSAKTKQICPRARSLITVVIPRAISFSLNVVARMVEELELSTAEEKDTNLIAGVANSVRRGYDSLHKLEFANKNKARYPSRVQVHIRYAEIYGF